MTNNPEKALLDSLNDAAPFLLPERTLFAEVCNRLYTPVSYDEFRALLILHKQKDRIESIATEDGPKWQICDAGHARQRRLR